jgi:hypothetical protein
VSSALTAFMARIPFWLRWGKARYWHVWLGEHSFHIGDQIRWVEIPFTELADIIPEIRPQAITLVFKSPTALGQQFAFLPRESFFHNKIYVELLQLLRPFLLQAIHEENERLG